MKHCRYLCKLFHLEHNLNQHPHMYYRMSLAVCPNSSTASVCPRTATSICCFLYVGVSNPSASSGSRIIRFFSTCSAVCYLFRMIVLILLSQSAAIDAPDKFMYFDRCNVSPVRATSAICIAQYISALSLINFDLVGLRPLLLRLLLLLHPHRLL